MPHFILRHDVAWSAFPSPRYGEQKETRDMLGRMSGKILTLNHLQQERRGVMLALTRTGLFTQHSMRQVSAAMRTSMLTSTYASRDIESKPAERPPNTRVDRPVSSPAQPEVEAQVSTQWIPGRAPALAT